MSSLKYLHWTPAHAATLPQHPARRAAASALRSTSALLARLARRVGHVAPPAPGADPRLEFYAEAGAPEGALYLDGQLVGRLSGVTRL